MIYRNELFTERRDGRASLTEDNRRLFPFRLQSKCSLYPAQGRLGVRTFSLLCYLVKALIGVIPKIIRGGFEGSALHPIREHKYRGVSDAKQVMSIPTPPVPPYKIWSQWRGEFLNSESMNPVRAFPRNLGIQKSELRDIRVNVPPIFPRNRIPSAGLQKWTEL